eukprot:m.230843 g.230843  ORF g.230843 m.230843 type:complete len:115 (+) comp33589_c0_seq1:75-419(+)
MSDDAYASMGGGLKLKGLKTAGKKKKKSRKDKMRMLESTIAKSGKLEKGVALKAEYEDQRTETQRKFDELRESRESKRIQEKALLTHKEKVDAMNKYLETLSEHYDVPKVSWTK